MSNQHTPEPWPFGATPIGSKEDAISLFKQSLDAHEGLIGDFFYEIYDDEARRIAFLIGPSALANSSRIVACVNACAGITNHDLEYVSSKGGFARIAEEKTMFSKYAEKLEKHRDEYKSKHDVACQTINTLQQHRDCLQNNLSKSMEGVVELTRQRDVLLAALIKEHGMYEGHASMGIGCSVCDIIASVKGGA